MNEVGGKTAGILQVGGATVELLSGDGGPESWFLDKDDYNTKDRKWVNSVSYTHLTLPTKA